MIKILLNQNYMFQKILIFWEYHQAYAKCKFFDFGYTNWDIRKLIQKEKVEINHIFLQNLQKILICEKIQNELDIIFQNVSNDKYLKLYKLDRF